MPYVRERGNHLAIVHGARHPTTKKVEQQVLVTIHSKAEVLAAIGKTDLGRGGRQLRPLLEWRYPGVRFDWEVIERTLDEMKDRLPDTVPAREGRHFRDFRANLLGFSKQLALADPQSLTSARDLLAEQRTELEWVAELIRWRLDMLDHARDNEWTRDPFGWTLALSSHEVPPEMEEMAANYWEKGELERAEKVFGLLVDAFPGYAEGWNYLGLVALRRRDHAAAIDRFERTVRLGRALFPRRIPKKEYWRDHKTRPYMRGLMNLATALIRAGRYDEALAAAQRLEVECGDEDAARHRRVLVHLNRRDWHLALDATGPERHRGGSDSLLAALAAIELGDLALARAEFVRAVLGAPRAVAILLGFHSTSEPHSFREVQEHNEGVELHASLERYLEARSASSKRFTRQIWQHPVIESLRREIDTLEREWEAAQGGDRRPFDRLNEIRSRTFATKTVTKLADGGEKPRMN
jgi:tetratricopeptide (TPR) repeat protein